MKTSILNYLAILLFAVVPAFSQAGGEILSVKITKLHFGSPTEGVDWPEVAVNLRVVDATGNQYTTVEILNESDAKLWFGDETQRRSFLINRYLRMFQYLGSHATPSGDAPNARIDTQRAQNFISLADLTAIAGCKVITPDAAPQVIRRVEASYPDQARAAKVNGKVVLQVTIKDDGSVDNNVVVVSGIGYGLNESAVVAIRQWKFKPEIRDCVPVTKQLNIEFNFNIR